MTALCLFVVMAALFITVLNSHTAKSVTLNDKTNKHLLPLDKTNGN